MIVERTPFIYTKNYTPFFPGNYSVYLLSKGGNYSTINSYFRVVPIPLPLYTLGNFAFSNGLAITIPIIIAIGGIVYQIISTNNQENKRKKDQLFSWLINNSKYFLGISTHAFRISKCMVIKGNSNEDVIFQHTRVMYEIVKFYEYYVMQFKQKTDMFYFDNVNLESFISDVSAA